MKPKTINFKAKADPRSLPAGASIAKKEMMIYVEEIENGYLITKELSIEYILEGDINHMWIEKKSFSKTNPLKGLKVNTPTEEGEFLADKL